MKDVNQVADNTLDSLNKARTARPIAGASRKGNHPVLFLVGNSTMRTGTLDNGAGDITQLIISIPIGSPSKIMPWEEPAAVPSTTAFGRM